MRNHPLTAAVAAVILALAVAACGDDDDDETSEEPEPSETTESESEEAPAEGDVAAYCDASLAIETLPEPDVDFETATEEEIAAAFRIYATDELQPLVEEGVAAAPDEIGEDVAVLADGVDELASSGDPAVFETPEWAEASDRVHQFDLENCGWNQQAVEATEYSFSGLPSELPAGPISFEFANTGQELHELGLARKNDGVTLSTEEILALPEEEALEMVTLIGAPAFAGPGEDAYKVVDLEPGEYIVACFIPVGMTSLDQEPPADAPPHVAQGMVAEFTVN